MEVLLITLMVLLFPISVIMAASKKIKASLPFKKRLIELTKLVSAAFVGVALGSFYYFKNGCSKVGLIELCAEIVILIIGVAVATVVLWLMDLFIEKG